MALYHRSSEKKRICHDFRRQEEEVIGSLCRLGSRPISPKTQLEQEKRIRREIANSNERRRMQSINAGFQSLRTLLPHHDGEKLSKAAILQHTAEYIYQLEQEKTRLLSQNCQLKRLISSQSNHDSDGSSSDSPLPKRKKIEPAELSDEGIGNMSPSGVEPGIDELKQEMIELRVQLARERRLRMAVEEQTRNLEAQLYPERIREIAHQVQLQYQHPDDNSGSESMKTFNNSAVENNRLSISSPLSQLSGEDMETSDELLLKEIPEHIVEIPQDLSGKNNPLLTEAEISFITTTSPSIKTEMLEEPLQITSVSIPETVVQPQAHVYSASTSRQNLETIVEAIRHLEGDHLFCDDPEPSQQQNSLSTSSQVDIAISIEAQPLEITERRLSSPPNSEFSIRQQIIQSAPLSQSRPGVIVTNHS